MKRCPQCQFIHLDQDDFCDFDGTQLLVEDELELTAASAAEAGQTPDLSAANRTTTTGVGNRRLAFWIIVAIAVGASLSVAYLGITGRFRATPTPAMNSAATTIPSQTPTAILNPLPSPEVVSSPTPESSPADARVAPSPANNSARGVVSKSPVSTGSENNSGNGLIKIRLKNGAVVEADEVWRTREGVWYRRNGMVTLLKRDRVSAIEKAKAPAKTAQ